MPLPRRPPGQSLAARSARQASGTRQEALSPRPCFPGSPGHKGSPSAAGLCRGDSVVSPGPSKPSAREDEEKTSVLPVGGRLWENGRVRQSGGEPEMYSALGQAPLGAGLGSGGSAGWRRL